MFLIWFIPPVWRLDTGSTTVTQWQRVKGERRVKVGPDQAGWISSRAVSRHLLHAVIVAEDSRFYQHPGLDFVEIKHSIRLNFKRGGYARGASTITQQVVKMALLSRDKTLIRKLREAVGALLLESMVSKRRIIEWYINLAEFGDGIYGARQASKHYFQTKPELLTIQQSVHLALVLPSPNGWSVGLRRKNLTDFGHLRFATILGRMHKRGYITEQQWFAALATGNFGRPVKKYEEVLAKLDAEDAEAERLSEQSFDEFLKERNSRVEAAGEGEEASEPESNTDKTITPNSLTMGQPSEANPQDRPEEGRAPEGSSVEADAANTAEEAQP